jgi:hypothetical protein
MKQVVGNTHLQGGGFPSQLQLHREATRPHHVQGGHTISICPHKDVDPKGVISVGQSDPSSRTQYPTM